MKITQFPFETQFLIGTHSDELVLIDRFSLSTRTGAVGSYLIRPPEGVTDEVSFGWASAWVYLPVRLFPLAFAFRAAAAAKPAFFARAERCLGVILLAAFLPPIKPPDRPHCRKSSRTSAGNLFRGIVLSYT
jgi:hypothetical protein